MTPDQARIQAKQRRVDQLGGAWPCDLCDDPTQLAPWPNEPHLPVEFMVCPTCADRLNNEATA